MAGGETPPYAKKKRAECKKCIPRCFNYFLIYAQTGRWSLADQVSSAYLFIA